MKPRYTPTLEEFRDLAKQGNLVPVYREFLADQDTPVGAFRKLAAGHETAFLFESVEGGERWGRYSYLGFGADKVIRAREKTVVIKRDGKRESLESADPTRELAALLAETKAVRVPGLPRFWGGAVGYLGYDCVRYFERLKTDRENELDTDDMVFATTEVLVVFDNVTHSAQVIANADLRKHPSPERAYTAALERIDEVVSKLRAPLAYEPRPAAKGELRVDSNLSQAKYEAMVRAGKEYVQAGDVIQVVLSQRFSAKLEADPIDLYRALRHLNPSPYLFYLQLPDVRLIGSSPEIMVRLEEGRQVTVRPIAGTRKRGKTLEEDAALEEELLADPKELAEHVMLVDLGRNDVGRVSEVGSVNVDELMIVERYSHVMHIVSNVRGKLRPGLDAFDLVRATFPAGTLSGAPKIRAMEIIDELEPSRRGPYGGAVGYIGWGAEDMDLAIAIRTFVLTEGMVSFQAGAGIVADSNPTAEFEETRNKAAALRRALEMAREGLD